MTRGGMIMVKKADTAGDGGKKTPQQKVTKGSGGQKGVSKVSKPSGSSSVKRGAGDSKQPVQRKREAVERTPPPDDGGDVEREAVGDEEGASSAARSSQNTASLNTPKTEAQRVKISKRHSSSPDAVRNARTEPAAKASRSVPISIEESESEAEEAPRRQAKGGTMGRGAPAARVGGECGTSSSRRAVAAPRDRDRGSDEKGEWEDEEFVLPQRKRISLTWRGAATEQGRRGGGSKSGQGSASNHDGGSSGDEIDDKDYYPNENNNSRDKIDQGQHGQRGSLGGGKTMSSREIRRAITALDTLILRTRPEEDGNAILPRDQTTAAVVAHVPRPEREKEGQKKRVWWKENIETLIESQTALKIRLVNEALSSLRSGDKERAKRKVTQAKAVTKFIRAVKGFEGRGHMQRQMVVCLEKELDAQAEG
uniref:Uncharacterized protein n=1 Tax=Chromera velia CCMP2878 TaxID=1169474 RepID=A0A0G4FZN9_9ALVE|eukprot:Cvel_19572.t1-p1 / transcript=Cvel_19572.t1 / gene=Cvel_19572 / organism=Chromera_velia_CCMP2878 / gene_product=hypothetical protein / transcript_product=hypothetical protein / location=Cvel_scaffold1698:2384-3985(-) / protein_length=423 / sequence_SO=supercontig / SO=protein_coding / is_pseudo=false